MASSDRFVKFAGFNLAWLIGVILFGAWVRITGSGAGCGSHWPTCNGEIIPRIERVETIIEFTHRLTSGACGILGLILIGWAWARFGARHMATRAAIVTLFFVIFEGLIGAGIVLKSLVEDDSSVARAVVVALHLVNTLVLTGAASGVVWWGAGRPSLRFSGARGALKWWLLAALLGIIAVSMTGAITALGDTLFPSALRLGPQLWTDVRADMGADQHFLVRLRAVHPVVAMLAALLLILVGDRARFDGASPSLRRGAGAMMVIVIAQVLLGIVNIALSAPGWMQLIHLLVAKILWLVTLVTFALSLTEGQDPAEPAGEP